jgi:hypothetical protein
MRCIKFERLVCDAEKYLRTPAVPKMVEAPKGPIHSLALSAHPSRFLGLAPTDASAALEEC